MAEIKWIKLSVNMFDDEKIKLIETMPEADTIIVIWVKLLALAGRSNMGGYIMLTETIPYTEDMLMSIMNRPLSTIRMALATFQRFGMFELSEDGAFFLTNWEKHQNVDGMDKVRIQTNARVKKHRESKKGLLLPETEKRFSNVTVTECNATDIEVDLELDKDKDNCCFKGPDESKPIQTEQDADLAGDAVSHRTDEELDYRKQISSLYLSRRGKGLEITMKDEVVIDDLLANKVPIQIVLEGINKSFDRFKPKHSKQEIKSLSYCSGMIYDLHAAETSKENEGAAISDENEDKITLSQENIPSEEEVQEMLELMRSKRGGA
ncbi:putative phage replisome organizer [Paenibacillus sp. PastF-3]|uniref:phage replisome organizer N-terminal domain-containing protein n=1 Tax=Paenibacillus sp. PastF-3 TaxID=2940626 RepID=UPI002473B281|nr:phage replisome organizer N-terminal domain-containing protein [Paenibacillus sp. PastF-3]MDH6373577.1 putative phage replisome organizer [Paenibacillus sp. PastF-3]